MDLVEEVEAVTAALDRAGIEHAACGGVADIDLLNYLSLKVSSGMVEEYRRAGCPDLVVDIFQFVHVPPCSESETAYIG